MGFGYLASTTVRGPFSEPTVRLSLARVVHLHLGVNSALLTLHSLFLVGGKQARAHVRTRRHGKIERQRNAAAASTIQNRYRDQRKIADARRELEKRRFARSAEQGKLIGEIQTQSATRMQAMYRGHATRKGHVVRKEATEKIKAQKLDAGQRRGKAKVAKSTTFITE